MPNFGSSIDIAGFLDRKYRVQEMEAAAKAAEVASMNTFRTAQGGLVGEQTKMFAPTAQANIDFTKSNTAEQLKQTGWIDRINAANVRGMNASAAGREGENTWISPVRSAQVGLDRANAANVGASTIMTGLQGSNFLQKQSQSESDLANPTFNPELGLDGFLSNPLNPFREMFGGGLGSVGPRARRRRPTSILRP